MGLTGNRSRSPPIASRNAGSLVRLAAGRALADRSKAARRVVRALRNASDDPALVVARVAAPGVRTSSHGRPAGHPGPPPVTGGKLMVLPRGVSGVEPARGTDHCRALTWPC
jgi:hypothetical protein